DATEHGERADLDRLRAFERVFERGSRRLEISAPPGGPAERPGSQRPRGAVALGPPRATRERPCPADVVPRQCGPRKDAGAYDGRPERARGRCERLIETALALQAASVESQQPATRKREANVAPSLRQAIEPPEPPRPPAAPGDTLPDRGHGTARGCGVAARKQVFDGLRCMAGGALGGGGTTVQLGGERPVAPARLGAPDPPRGRLEPGT